MADLKIVRAKDNEFNRKILESKKCDVILSVENGNRKDSLKQVDSGLNEVLAKIATKNNISIGIDLSGLANLEKKEKAIRLARIMQNISICRKAKTKLAIVNPRSMGCSFSFLTSLGASTQQASQATEKTISF